MREYAQHFWKGPTWTFPLFTQYWPTVAFPSFGTNLHKGFPGNCDTSCTMGSCMSVAPAHLHPLHLQPQLLNPGIAGLVSAGAPGSPGSPESINIELVIISYELIKEVTGWNQWRKVIRLPSTSADLVGSAPSTSSWPKEHPGLSMSNSDKIPTCWWANLVGSTPSTSSWPKEHPGLGVSDDDKTPTCWWADLVGSAPSTSSWPKECSGHGVYILSNNNMALGPVTKQSHLWADQSRRLGGPNGQYGCRQVLSYNRAGKVYSK